MLPDIPESIVIPEKEAALGLAVSYAFVKQEHDAKVVALNDREAALAEAQINFAQAEEQRRAADKSSRQARQAVDEFFTRVSESTLLDVPGLQPLASRQSSQI